MGASDARFRGGSRPAAAGVRRCGRERGKKRKEVESEEFGSPLGC